MKLILSLYIIVLILFFRKCLTMFQFHSWDDVYFIEFPTTVDCIRWPKLPLSPTTTQAITDLIARVLDSPSLAQLFQISINTSLAINDKDVFRINNGSTSGSILISASSGVAAATAFNYYLKYVTNSSCTSYVILF